MRIVFIGASEVAVMTTEALLEQGHQVVMIESDQKRVEQLSEMLDCSFLQGDGGSPAVLREVEPEQVDVLFCISNDDKSNMIASLVGRSLGFKRVVTSIEDPEFEPICRELGLEETIVPARALSKRLEDIVRGIDIVELSTVLKDEARFFTFIADSLDATSVAELELPEAARVICYYRDGHFSFADPDTKLRQGDEVVVLTRSDNLPALRERWEPKHTGNGQASTKD